jgi:hypothetical protein
MTKCTKMQQLNVSCLHMAYFVWINGCVNFHETIPVQEKLVLMRCFFLSQGAFFKNAHIAPNFIPPSFNYLTNSVIDS